MARTRATTSQEKETEKKKIDEYQTRKIMHHSSARVYVLFIHYIYILLFYTYTSLSRSLPLSLSLSPLSLSLSRGYHIDHEKHEGVERAARKEKERGEEEEEGIIARARSLGARATLPRGWGQLTVRPSTTSTLDHHYYTTTSFAVVCMYTRVSVEKQQQQQQHQQQLFPRVIHVYIHIRT